MKIINKSFLLNLGKDMLSYGAVGVIGRFASFFTAPIYTRILAPSDYGILDTLTMILPILSLMSTFQLESSLLRIFFESKEVIFRKKLFSTGLYVFLPISIIITIILIPHVAEISTLLFKKSQNYLLVLLTILQLTFLNVRGYAIIILRAEFRRKAYVRFNFLLMIFSGLFGIIALVVFKLGLLGLIISQLTIEIIFSIIALSLVRKYLTLSFSFPILKEMLKFGIPIIPSSVSSYAQQYISKYFILVLYTMYSMGIYSIGTKIASPILILVSTLSQAWVPYAYEKWEEPDSKKNFKLFFNLFTMVISFIVILLVVFSNEIVLIFATKVYLPAKIVVGFIALWMLLAGTLGVIIVGMNIIKRTYINSYITISGLTVSSLAIYLFASHLNLLGIAVGAFVGRLVSYLMTIYFTKKYFKDYFSFGFTSYLILTVVTVVVLFAFFPSMSIVIRITLLILWIASLVIALIKVYNINLKKLILSLNN